MSINLYQPKVCFGCIHCLFLFHNTFTQLFQVFRLIKHFKLFFALKAMIIIKMVFLLKFVFHLY